MTTSKVYADLATLKARILPSNVTDTTDDGTLSANLEAISRAIDGVTRRRFYTTDSDETRYYTHSGPSIIFFCPDDIVSVTTLKTDCDGDRTYEDSWTQNTDYDLMPYNASLDGGSYTWIETCPNGSYAFPNTRKGVQMVGKFGWSAVPAMIREATLLLAHRLFNRKDMPFGRKGVPQLGVIEMETQIKNDPELMLMLDRYIRRV